MDFLSGLTRTPRGNDFLFLVADRLTKRLVLIPTEKSITGAGAARLFVQRVFREHGLPRVIISDRDPRFTGAFWRQLHQMLGTRLMMSTANHPQTDGQSERSLRTVLAMIRHYVDELGSDWDEHLWALEFAYNDSVHAVTGFSPFQADLGRDPATPCTLLARLAERIALAGRKLPPQQRRDLAAAEDFADAMRERLRMARHALIRAQHSQELAEASRPQGMVFAPGDYVFLRQDALGGEPLAGKLGPRWYPQPLRVSERVGANAYRLMVPKEWGLHPVRNVAELKPAGEIRPQAVAGPVLEPEGLRAGHVLQFVEATEADGERRLRVRVAYGGRKASGSVLARTARDQLGFAAVASFSRTTTAPLPNHLGRLVLKEFIEPTSGELRAYEGIVAAYDPKDPDQQFQVLYEDWDEEWLPASALTAILIDAKVIAMDVARLGVMAEQTEADWRWGQGC